MLIVKRVKEVEVIKLKLKQRKSGFIWRERKVRARDKKPAIAGRTERKREVFYQSTATVNDRILTVGYGLVAGSFS
ncbi:conserved hypothetical protein [Ricinus communis]|uniref:Uncharacterized protein n=1 Tax=Ricinus communis TaxID=3988 RepID=B9SN82_RICCO|nr:conserved hypothetical protein [Ricinus communis]